MEILIGAIGLVLLLAVGMVIGYKLDDDSDTFGDLLKVFFLVLAVCMAVFGIVDAGKVEAERNFLLGKYEIRYEKNI